MKLAKLGLIAALTAGVLYAGNYNIDVSHSNVGFKVKHLMISNVKGQFDKFNSNFEYDEKTKKLLSLKADIDVNSINTSNAKRDKHLQSADFFDVAKYQNITFELTKTQNDKAYGKLTMHGVTKDIVLDFENNGVAKDPYGNTRVGFALSGKLDRTDYGLVYNSALETGGLMIGEIVKLDVEVEGVLEE